MLSITIYKISGRNRHMEDHSPKEPHSNGDHEAAIKQNPATLLDEVDPIAIFAAVHVECTGNQNEDTGSEPCMSCAEKNITETPKTNHFICNASFFAESSCKS